MSRSYKITAFDESVAALASRFAVAHPSIILDLNPDIFDEGGDATLAFEPSFVGLEIRLPDDPRTSLYDWESYTAHKGETLAAICAKKNKDRRIDPSQKHKGIPSPPWLEPQYLLDLYENANLRASHGPKASTITLGKGETVVIPFPKNRSGAKPIFATPNGKTKVQFHPPFIDEIDGLVKSFQERTRKFESSMIALRHQKELGLREVQVLQAAKAVLTMEMEHPAGGPSQVGRDIAGMKSFGQVLDDLTTVAMNEMFSKVGQYLLPKVQKEVLDLGNAIVQDLHGDTLKRLTKSLVKVADQFPRTTNELSWALSYAYLTLADSPVAEEIRPDIEAAARFLAGVKKLNVSGLTSVDPKLAQAIQALPKAGDPMDPLSNLVSLLSVAGSSVGNLPGPSTLAVAMVRLKAMFNGCKQLAERQNSMTWTLSVGEQAVFTAMSVNVLATGESEGAELLLIVGKVRVATLTQTPLYPESFDVKYMKSFLEDLDKATNDGIMSSPRWVRGMSAFNILVAGLAAYDMWGAGGAGVSLGGVTSVLAGVTAATSGVLKLLGKNLLAEGCGRAVAAIGVIYGTVQAIRTWHEDKTNAVLNMVNAVGSALLLGSCFFAVSPFGPVLATIGGILVIGSGIAMMIRDLSKSSTSRWWEGIASAFEDGDVYKAVKDKAPALAAKVQSWKTALKGTTFLLIDDDQADTLRKLVPQQSAALLLATNSVPFEMPLGI